MNWRYTYYSTASDTNCIVFFVRMSIIRLLRESFYRCYTQTPHKDSRTCNDILVHETIATELCWGAYGGGAHRASRRRVRARYCGRGARVHRTGQCGTRGLEGKIQTSLHYSTVWHNSFVTSWKMWSVNPAQPRYTYSGIASIVAPCSA